MYWNVRNSQWIINKFIKYDIPFQGKISSVSREQKEIQEIIDVLYKAVKIIDKKNKAFLKNISNIKTHLKQYIWLFKGILY